MAWQVSEKYSACPISNPLLGKKLKGRATASSRSCFATLRDSHAHISSFYRSSATGMPSLHPVRAGASPPMAKLPLRDRRLMCAFVRPAQSSQTTHRARRLHSE